MSQRKPLLYLLVFATTFVLLSGCNTVGQKKYLSIAFDERNPRTAAEVYGYVPPRADLAEPAPAPPIVGFISDGPLYTAPGNGELRRFTYEVNHQLVALDRDLDLIQTRARIKGAAAQAAIDLNVRDFRSYSDRIGDRLRDLQQSDSDGRPLARYEIAALLDDAQRSVQSAQRNIQSIHAVD